jgi:nickel-dependent lactate racemase
MIETKRPVVIVSCGGAPYDINLIQAHKALDQAAHACTEGGTIILLAQCPDGLGHPTFLKWFDEQDAHSLEIRLRNSYEVNGQTAWSLLEKAERYRIQLVSDLPPEVVRKMRLTPARSLADAVANLDAEAEGYVIQRGSALLPIT